MIDHALHLRQRTPTERISTRREQLAGLEAELERLTPQQMTTRIASLARSAVALADHPTNDLNERMKLLSAAGRCAFEATVLESALHERGLT